MLYKVEKMNKSYFLYDEDNDYCFWVLKAGYKLYYCNDVIVYHKIRALAGDMSYLGQYYIMRNELYITKKYVERKYGSYLYRTYRFFQELNQMLK